MKTRIAVAVTGLSMILAACGGGGGSNDSLPTTTPSVSAAGQYRGTANGRQALVVALDDGRFYTEYSSSSQSTLIAGVVAGNVNSASGTLSSGSGYDYNLEGQGVNAVTLSGSYTAKQSMKASVAYANGAKSDFSGTYDSSYDTTPTQAAVVGTFKGSSAINVNSGTRTAFDSITLTVDANGGITGNGTNCAFTGVIKPHASGNVYDISLTFGSGAGCAYPTTSASGVGVLTGSLMHAWLQTPAKAAVLFLGTR
jgi:hypothetical protein